MDSWYLCDPVIRDAYFSGNSAAGSGGALYSHSSVNWDIRNAKFFSNTARQGGVFRGQSGPFLKLRNAVFAFNVPEYPWEDSDGGAIHVSAMQADIQQCTFFGNANDEYGGAVYGNLADVTIANSILWSNKPHEVYVENGSTLDIMYSDIEGGYPGTRDQLSDPLFTNPFIFDFHLQPTSACIDSGTTFIDTSLKFDIEWNPRKMGIAPDMGAYEFGICWIGKVTDDRHTAENWSHGSVPTASDEVTIPSPLRYIYAPVVRLNASCHRLLFLQGASVQIENGVLFQLIQ